MLRMNNSLLATKLHIPRLRQNAVSRPRLLHRLNEGSQSKLILLSAAAGFGKTSLLSEWVSFHEKSVAWISLDPEDSELSQFLLYVISALQTVSAGTGATISTLLQSPQPPPPESLLTALVNEIDSIHQDFFLILDDYHLVDSKQIDEALNFLIQRMSPQMHLVISSREDPLLPLAKLRARGELTELRDADLRFTPDEASSFLNGAMTLSLSPSDIASLETRTEGWIAGLQLAALSVRAQPNASAFIASLTGSHHFILDYLLEEVLHRQSLPIQNFLFQTSILDRMCGPLCDALLADNTESDGDGQKTLEQIERANLFIVPLDDERRWYRYHHLFGDLLRQRLSMRENPRDLYIRASVWSEENGLEIEAFDYAVKANDLDRAERLMKGRGIPLHFRGGAATVIKWLETLPEAELETRPSLLVAHGVALLFISQVMGIEDKLQAAERAIERIGENSETRDLTGQIAGIRATLAVTKQDPEPIIEQSMRALEYLSESNVAVRTATTWVLGFARQLQGNRSEAKKEYIKAYDASIKIGHPMVMLLTTIGLAELQAQENRLQTAMETFQKVLQLSTNPLQTVASLAYIGLARIFYEMNDLDSAQANGEKSLALSRLIEYTDRSASCEIFLSHIALARRDYSTAAALLENAEEDALLHGYAVQLPRIAEAQVRLCLLQGKLEAAASIPNLDSIPHSKARILLAKGFAKEAVEILESLRKTALEKKWQDELLKTTVLLSLAYEAGGEKDKAVLMLLEAMEAAEPSGFVRIFMDEGNAMAKLLTGMAKTGPMKNYAAKLLSSFGISDTDNQNIPNAHKGTDLLVEPLSQREIDVLRLIAQGLSNQEICERLFLALSTVKGHNLNIFGKLQVQRRTEAVARARELGLI